VSINGYGDAGVVGEYNAVVSLSYEPPEPIEADEETQHSAAR